MIRSTQVALPKPDCQCFIFNLSALCYFEILFFEVGVLLYLFRQIGKLGTIGTEFKNHWCFFLLGHDTRRSGTDTCSSVP